MYIRLAPDHSSGPETWIFIVYITLFKIRNMKMFPAPPSPPRMLKKKKRNSLCTVFKMQRVNCRARFLSEEAVNFLDLFRLWLSRYTMLTHKKKKSLTLRMSTTLTNTSAFSALMMVCFIGLQQWQRYWFAMYRQMCCLKLKTSTHWWFIDICQDTEQQNSTGDRMLCQVRFVFGYQPRYLCVLV